MVGAEYTSRMFDHEIDHEVTTPFTPPHIGITERRNKSVLGMPRCMLKQKACQTHFGEKKSQLLHM